MPCEWFADHGPALLEPEAIQTEAIRTQVILRTTTFPAAAAGASARTTRQYNGSQRDDGS